MDHTRRHSYRRDHTGTGNRRDDDSDLYARAPSHAEVSPRDEAGGIVKDLR
jgi:hypothetical protein